MVLGEPGGEIPPGHPTPDFAPSGKIPDGMTKIGVFLERITSRQESRDCWEFCDKQNEIQYCYPVGDLAIAGKSHLVKG